MNCRHKLDFYIPVGKNGDCYYRYLCRMLEMRESISIIKQVISKIRICGDKSVCNSKLSPPNRKDMKMSMESLINHFKKYTEGFKVF